MNPRIKELADKVADIMPAGVYNLRYESGKRGVEFTEDALEKFAQLIVRECIQVVDDIADPEEDSDRYVWALHNASEKIKQHFGVE